MTKVSIIVPVYNVEEYLEKCLDSLVNQTLNDIEIIIVNDGSPDNSKKIMETYEKKYPKKIKCFYNENKGVAEARNFGIKKASADLIGFVDSDDWVELDMFEKLYNKSVAGNFDVTICGLNYIYPDKVIVRKPDFDLDIKNKSQIKKSILNMFPVVWNKLYKKELFEKVKFNKGIWFEDVEMLYRLWPNIKSIGVVNNYAYNYLQRGNSLSSSFDRRLYDYITNWNIIVDFYKDKKIYEEFQKEIEFCYVRYVYATFIIRMAKCSDKIEFNEAVKVAQENVNRNFPNYKRNKYFYKAGLKGIYMLFFSRTTAGLVYKINK